LGIPFAGIRDNRSLSFATVFGLPEMSYFVEVPVKGCILVGELPRVISVFSSDPRYLVGIGTEVDRTQRGLAVWRLMVGGADVPGRWIIVEGDFVQLGDMAESGR
jgi:hypothetical protein